MARFIINVHSAIDIITNSSSEIFVINDKNVEIIKQIIDNSYYEQSSNGYSYHIEEIKEQSEVDYHKYDYDNKVKIGTIIVSIERGYGSDAVTDVLKGMSDYYTMDG